MQTRADLELRYDGPVPRKDLIDCSLPSKKVTQAEWLVLDARRRLHSALIKVKFTGMIKRETRTGHRLTDYRPFKNHRDAVHEALSLRKLRDERIGLCRTEQAARVPDTVAAE